MSQNRRLLRFSQLETEFQELLSEAFTRHPADYVIAVVKQFISNAAYSGRLIGDENRRKQLFGMISLLAEQLHLEIPELEPYDRLAEILYNQAVNAEWEMLNSKIEESVLLTESQKSSLGEKIRAAYSSGNQI